MKTNRHQAKFIAILALTLILIYLGYGVATTIYVGTSFYYGFQTYTGAYVNFDSAQTKTNVCRLNDIWYFNGFGMQIENGNATISDFFQSDPQTIGATINAPTGTVSSTRFDSALYGEPQQVNVSDSLARWVYNSTTHIFMVNATHASPILLGITWTPVGTSSIGTYYMRNETHTVNYVAGYDLNLTQGDDVSLKELSAVGDVEVYFGYRVYVVYYDGNVTELTSGSPSAITTRAVNGVGLQNATWNCPATFLEVNFDALEVDLYMRIGAGAWLKEATFITDVLDKKQLQAAAWMFSTYTNRTSDGANTYATVNYGDPSVNTAIYGVAMKEASIFDLINAKYKLGDFIGAILLPYTNLVGNLFYGLIMLLICVPTYRRYQSFTPILILFFILGGIGGFVGLLIPPIASGIAWLFFAVGLAGLIYKVIR